MQLTKREKVEFFLKRNPKLPRKKIAELVGCSTVWVYKIAQKPREPMMVRGVRIPISLNEHLKTYCRKNKIYVSQLIRELLIERFYLDKIASELSSDKESERRKILFEVWSSIQKEKKLKKR